jgi:hypothetical protein
MGGGYHGDSSTDLVLFNIRFKDIDEKLSAKQNSIENLGRKISHCYENLENLVLNDANEGLVQVHKERLACLRDEKNALRSEKQSLRCEKHSLIVGWNLRMQQQNILMEQERTGGPPNVWT